MTDRPRWVQNTIEFFIDNGSVLATPSTASYVIFRQSNAATKLATDDLIAAVLGLLALSEFIERYRRLNSIEKISKKALLLLESHPANRPSALSLNEPQA
jgi:hypothetical protein